MKTSSQLHEELINLCRSLGVAPKRTNSWVVTSEAEALWVVANGGFITSKTASRIWKSETQEQVALRLLNCDSPVCTVCGNKLVFKSLVSGWSACSNDTCSRKCAEKHPLRLQERSNRGKHARSFVKNLAGAWTDDARAKRISTNIQRYGHSTARCADVEEKRKRTLNVRFGVSNSFETPRAKAARSSRKHIEKSGSLQTLLDRNPLFESVHWDGHARKSTWKCRRCALCFDDVETSPIRAIRCPTCDPPKSSLLQHRFAEQLTSHGIEVVANTRKVIRPLELDIWIPQHKVAVEIDGLYWHSFGSIETKEQRLASLIKVKRCEKEGIRLFIFREDELLARPEVCLSMVMNACGRSTRHYARNLSLREISVKDANQFLDRHHLHGAAPASKAFGLFDKDLLLQVATVSRSRFEAGAHELVRLATMSGHQVQGGASRLIAAVAVKCTRLLAYANRAISNGAVYDKIGKFIREVPPGYTWWKDDRRINRMHAQRKKLPKLLGEMFDSSKTEAENMFASGWRRVWDSGHLLFDLSSDPNS